jgi:calcineurin-like phosphoesterase family protein
MKWFTADTHFGHANIILPTYCNRPWDSAEEMDEGLIANWNERVRRGDEVYHLGDFAFCKTARALEIRKRLNGQIFLIEGNHDRRMHKSLRETFVWVRQREEIKAFGKKIVLSHYAMRVWNQCHRGSWQLYGHSHGSLPPRGLQMDVGMDAHNYRPISLEEIKAVLEAGKASCEDYHGRLAGVD